PKLQKVIAKKGARQVHRVSYGSNHEHISVCPTISAAGTYIPSLIIYKGKRMISGLLDGTPAGTVMGFTDTGYMQKSLFRKYIEHFVNSIPPIHSVLLILDEHKSHVNYTCVNFCYKNNILLYTLPLHTTHILQLAELPFAQLKKIYDGE
ncbi:21190_t:CDS:1, partial [Cetraspora pellucida]